MSAAMDDKRESPWRLRLGESAVLAVAAALAHIALTWPVWSAPQSVVPGWPGDNLLFLWNLGWVAEGTAEQGASLGRVRALLWPEGFPFLFHTHTWLYALLYGAADRTLLRGAIADPFARLTFGYNAIMMLSSVLTALALDGVVRLSGARDRAARVLAVLAGTFCGARLFPMYGHLNLLGTEFFLATLLLVCIALRAPRGASFAWAAAGAAGGMGFLNDQTLGVFCGVAGGLGCVAVTAGSPAPGRAFLGAASCFGAAFLTVAAIHLVPLLAIWRSGDYVVASAHVRRTHDLLNFFLPSDYATTFGNLPWRLRSRFGIGGGSGVGHLGFALTGAVALCLWQRRGGFPERVRRRLRQPLPLFWALCVLTGLVGASGEWLTIAGRDLVPLPGRALRWVPGLANLRVPERWAIFLVVPLCVAAARGLADRRGAMLLFTLVLALESRRAPVLTRTDAAPVRLPAAVVAEIRERGGAVMTLPAGFENNLATIWQTQHGRPELFGRMTRLPVGTVEERLRRHAFLAAVLDDRTPSADPAAVQRFVAETGLRTVLVPPEGGAQFRRLLEVAPQNTWEPAVKFLRLAGT